MKKIIENLKWRPRWVSHLGCIKGCLEYLNFDVSDAWLFGATGHAFILNLHEIVCPSGPTAWNTEMLFKLGKNIGYTLDGVWGLKSSPDFAEKQKIAWEKTRQSIDQNLPCYGWELDLPEYYVVKGYDDKGYFFSGPGSDSGKKSKSWKELGDSGIGVLEMWCVRLDQPSDEIQTIKQALEFALEHSGSPAKWIFPKYKAGLAGYDSWIQAIKSGSAHDFGMAYNAAVWAECRKLAVDFLKEAQNKLGDRFKLLFEEATGHYEKVAQNLNEVSKLFPFPPKGNELKDTSRCEIARRCLRDAQKSEESGLKSLEKISSQL
jgi:hypothetical protein